MKFFEMNLSAMNEGALIQMNWKYRAMANKGHSEVDI